jgi:hypothetical protein
MSVDFCCGALRSLKWALSAISRGGRLAEAGCIADIARALMRRRDFLTRSIGAGRP